MKNAYDYLNNVKMDFSKYEEESITEREILDMRKKISDKKPMNLKRICVLAACAVFTFVCGTALAANYIRKVSTGHNEFYQYPAEERAVPEELRGLLFDKDGNELTKVEADMELYDKDGNLLDEESYAALIEDAFGSDVKVVTDKYDPETAEHTFASLEEAQETASFDIKIPEYLPEGYELDRVFTYTDGKGGYSGDYMTLVYKNGEKDIHIFERIINDETAFSAGTDGTLEEIELNGVTAVIMDGTSIDWETKDSVSVGISAKGNITKDELIKMAESTK